MEQESRGILFKGNSEGLVIVIPDGYEFGQVLEEIDDKVSHAARFFKGARIRVSYRGAALTPSQEEAVRNILDEKSGAIIESFSRDEESTQNSYASCGAKSAQDNQPPSRKLFFTGEDEGNCKFVRNTVRNGIRIEYDGNVVVMGDINPGGEVVATGNVIVLGTLRGMVHAGADGDRKAFIFALNLRPTQIRIAGAIARMPDEDRNEEGFCPVIATATDGTIGVEPIRNWR